MVNDKRKRHKLSVIIPMHNSFAMLKKSLDRFWKIKAFEVEVVVIDDCSTDSSFEDACKYADKHTNFIVVRNETNLGPGPSRNKGIELATGDYITFVDSDDYLSDDFEKEIKDVLERNVDCIIFDFLFVSIDGHFLRDGKSIEIQMERGLINTSDAFVFTQGSPWGKVYRKSIIDENHVEFPDLLRSEDLPFTKKALSCCKSIYYVPASLYMYVQHSSSLMHNSKLNDEKNCQKAFAYLVEGLDRDALKDELEVIELRQVLNNSVLVMLGNGEPWKKINGYISGGGRYHISLFRNKYLKRYSLKVKIITVLVYLRMFPLLKLLLKYKDRLREHEVVNETSKMN